jgi:hypothetical protein
VLKVHVPEAFAGELSAGAGISVAGNPGAGNPGADDISAAGQAEASKRLEAAYHLRLKEACGAYVQALRAQMRQEGRHHFQGRDKAMSRSPFSSPLTQPGEKRGRAASKGSPAFVAVTAAAIACIKDKLHAFREVYAEALQRFRAGARDTLFPEGTWKMVHLLGCQSAAACT